MGYGQLLSLTSSYSKVQSAPGKMFRSISLSIPLYLYLSITLLSVLSQHLYTLEQELKVPQPFLFAIMFDRIRKNWNAQAIPISSSSYVNRLSPPTEWRGLSLSQFLLSLHLISYSSIPPLPSQSGLRNEDLTKVTGIPGCVFCHASGFLMSNSTREGAIAMAQKVIESQPEETNAAIEAWKKKQEEEKK